MKDRDDRIDELVEVVCDFCPKCTGDCCYLTAFGKIVDANYRKADEVKDEVKKEMAMEIYSKFHEEIYRNFSKDSKITRQELFQFIQRVESQIFEEITK